MDESLQSFPPFYSQSPLLTDSNVPHPPLSKRGLKKLVGNENIVYGNLRELSRLCPDSSTKMYVHEFFRLQYNDWSKLQTRRFKGQGGRDNQGYDIQYLARERTVWSRKILMEDNVYIFCTGMFLFVYFLRSLGKSICLLYRKLEEVKCYGRC